jgi:hypothetical protein
MTVWYWKTSCKKISPTIAFIILIIRFVVMFTKNLHNWWWRSIVNYTVDQAVM